MLQSLYDALDDALGLYYTIAQWLFFFSFNETDTQYCCMVFGDGGDGVYSILTYYYPMWLTQSHN